MLISVQPLQLKTMLISVQPLQLKTMLISVQPLQLKTILISVQPLQLKTMLISVQPLQLKTMLISVQSLQLKIMLISVQPIQLNFLLLLLSAFSHQGSPQRIFNLQLLLSSASSSFTSTSAMSSFTTSINLLFGLPRFLFPGNSIFSILLPIYPSSFLSTCPYHLSLASRVFSPNRPTCAVPLMYSFLILSILVTPNENRNIFNSATSISASCLFVSATVSNPYNIAGLTATLYTFPFTLADTRLSQITPDILLQPFHPACTLFFTSLPHSPLLCTVEPRYVYSLTQC